MILALYYGMQEWDLLRLSRLQFFLFCLSVYFDMASYGTIPSFSKYTLLTKKIEICNYSNSNFISFLVLIVLVTPIPYLKRSLLCKFCDVELNLLLPFLLMSLHLIFELIQLFGCHLGRLKKLMMLIFIVLIGILMT